MKKYYCSSKKCNSCKYRASQNDMHGCDYVFIVGHSRGCDPGDFCTVYERGDRIESRNRISYKSNRLNYRSFNDDYKH